LKIFKPIVKEYAAAERGLTNGIIMHERKSKKMNMHRSLVARITCLNIVISIVALPFGLSLVNSAIDQGVDIIYDHMGTYQDGFREEEESGFFEPFDEFDPNI